MTNTDTYISLGEQVIQEAEQLPLDEINTILEEELKDYATRCN